MLILFDQGTPRPIRAFLKGHNVKTTTELGWSEFLNGELLRAAEEAGFDALVTTDKNFIYQQNLKDCKLAILVLGNAQWPIVRVHIEIVVAAVNAAKPGSYSEIEIPGDLGPAAAGT